MQQFQSPFLKHLQERGLINQITHPIELDKLMKEQKISAYIGFDCTAKSLHIGSLIQIMILQSLQSYGHQPIVLLGGGTTKIGDPSGKDEARQFLNDEQIKENLAGIKKTLEKFDLTITKRHEVDSGEYKPFIFVDNNEWLEDLKYIDFLRDVGRHFSVNKMLSFDSVKLRLERQQPLSFIEFNYMILQSYDFYHLNQDYGCILQIGGSDQWGNIVSGVDLTRKIAAIEDKRTEDKKITATFGLTTPLLTTSDGKKMGKTANGAIWLDEEMLSPLDYYQYFRNIDDKDVGKFLRFFTDLNLAEIAEVEKLEINQQKKYLAKQATEICHKEQGEECNLKAASIFSGDYSELPTKTIKLNQETIESGKKLVEILKELELCDSIGEAKRLIKGGGVKVDDHKITDENYLMTRNFELREANLKPAGSYHGREYPEVESYHFKLALGKKKFFRIIIEVIN